MSVEFRDVVVASTSEAVKNICGFALGSDWDISIRKASSAEEVREMCAQRMPELLIVDALMPDASRMLSGVVGRGVATVAINDTGDRRIRANERIPAPFVPSALHAALERLSS